MRHIKSNTIIIDISFEIGPSAMTDQNEQVNLLSHAISPESLEVTIRKITDKVKQDGDKPHATVEQQLKILSELAQFDLGRFLLKNQGINGYWTHYILTFPWLGRKTNKNNNGETLSDLENFILNRAPTILATQERFKIFLKENQTQVKPGATLACIPSGMAGELFYLNVDQVDDVSLVAIDYDPDALKDAKDLAERRNISKFVRCFHENAWDMPFSNEFDLISSNGLNIYEPNDEKVTELFRRFYSALKPHGKLVTSFLTYPPYLTDDCEWDFSFIDENDLLQQKVLFADIIGAKWQCYASSTHIKEQLTAIGFRDINIRYDQARMFPTVIAYK